MRLILVVDNFSFGGDHLLSRGWRPSLLPSGGA